MGIGRVAARLAELRVQTLPVLGRVVVVMMMEPTDVVMETTQVDTVLKPRRTRTVIPTEELIKLEELFLESNWPNRFQKQALATELGRTEQFVSIWFQNKRARVKKQQENVEFATAKRSNFTSEKTTSPTQLLGAKFQKTASATSSGLVNVMRHHTAGQSGSDSKLILNQKNRASLTESRQGIAGGDARRMANQQCYDETPIGYCRHDTLPYPSYHGTLQNVTVPRSTHNQSDYTAEVLPQANYNSNNVVESTNPILNHHSSRAEEPLAPTLLESMLTMIMLEEGMLPLEQYSECNAINHSLYGIRLHDGERLVYDTEFGLDVLPRLDMSYDSD